MRTVFWKNAVLWSVLLTSFFSAEVFSVSMDSAPESSSSPVSHCLPVMAEVRFEDGGVVLDPADREEYAEKQAFRLLVHYAQLRQGQCRVFKIKKEATDHGFVMIDPEGKKITFLESRGVPFRETLPDGVGETPGRFEAVMGGKFKKAQRNSKVGTLLEATFPRLSWLCQSDCSKYVDFPEGTSVKLHDLFRAENYGFTCLSVLTVFSEDRSVTYYGAVRDGFGRSASGSSGDLDFVSWAVSQQLRVLELKAEDAVNYFSGVHKFLSGKGYSVKSLEEKPEDRPAPAPVPAPAPALAPVPAPAPAPATVPALAPAQAPVTLSELRRLGLGSVDKLTKVLNAMRKETTGSSGERSVSYETLKQGTKANPGNVDFLTVQQFTYLQEKYNRTIKQDKRELFYQSLKAVSEELEAGSSGGVPTTPSRPQKLVESSTPPRTAVGAKANVLSSPPPPPGVAPSRPAPTETPSRVAPPPRASGASRPVVQTPMTETPGTTNSRPDGFSPPPAPSRFVVPVETPSKAALPPQASGAPRPSETPVTEKRPAPPPPAVSMETGEVTVLDGTEEGELQPSDLSEDDAIRMATQLSLELSEPLEKRRRTAD